jgi:hypothetical protein
VLGDAPGATRADPADTCGGMDPQVRGTVRCVSYAVAASGRWTDPDGVRRPGGEVHAWVPGTNQTLCGLALSRSQLDRFPHVEWADVHPDSGRHADEVRRVCPRCEAATGGGRDRPARRRDRPARRP